MSQPTTNPRRERVHAWERGMPLWHTLYVGLITIAVIVAVVDDDLPGLELAAALAIAGAMLGSYWLTFVRRDPWTNPTGRAVVHLTITFAGFAMLIALSPAFQWMQASLYGQGFFLLASRWAFASAAVVALIALGSQIITREGQLAPRVPDLFGALAVTGFLVVMGAWIGRIIEQSEDRHRLIAELEAARRQLADQERLAGMLAERQRLSREIHDTVAQDLTAIVMQLRAAAGTEDELAAARHRSEAERIAVEGLEEARRLVHALRPSSLDRGSLPEAMERVVEQWRSSAGVQARIRIIGSPRALHPELEVTLVRALQEGLANAARHASATTVDITLSYLPDAVTLDLADDGTGFDPAAVRQRPDSGLGLIGMRERAEQLGGRVAVESAPGSGTTIGLWLPAGAS